MGINLCGNECVLNRLRYVNDSVALDINLLSIYNASDNGISVFMDGNIFDFTTMK